MIKFKRLKSAIISSAVAISALAAPLTTAVTPSLTANAADGDNYAKLLQYSLYFYDANMCGDNSDCALSWRGNCHTNDEIPGGFHDAGDHAMFGQPQGYTAATLGWAYYEFGDAFDATGQTAHLKVITDKFAKFFRDATVLNGDTVQKVLIEKGEGNTDHQYWGPPETQGDRGRMLWSTGGAANVTAEYAAALAANYVNFKNPDDLKYAKALYNFSKQNPATYSCEFYGSGESGSKDELAWAAGWLYLATKDEGYLNDLKNGPLGYWVMNWENVALGAGVLLGSITGDWSHAPELGNLSGDGYKFYDKWGSARHNATAQMCSLVAAKHGKGDAGWAKGQMQYLTGDKSFANGQSYCLVCGFKPNASKNPHHRAASGTNSAAESNDGVQNKYTLIGALCGGPTDANGSYRDVRSDYVSNEVACDYNAGFVGAAAGLYSAYKTGSVDTNIEGVTKIYGGNGGSNNQTTPTTTTTTTTTQGGNNNNTTTTTTNGGNGSSSGDVVLEGSKLGATTEEGDDGAINNVAEFPHNGAKSLTMYLKVNSNDTEVSGGFGTWNGEWLQEEFSGVKVGSDKTVAIDYTIPSNAGTNIKAMVWWPHDDGVTIEKIVLHNGTSSGNNNTTTSRTTSTTSRTTTTTTNGGNGSSSGDVVLEGSKLGATTEEGDDGAINNVAEFPHNGAKSLTMYLKVNSNDTEVSGGFGTWNGEWLQEEFSGVKVGSDKTVAIDYTIPSNAGTNIKAMVWWPHDDGVTIQKIVLHGGSGSSNNTTSKTTTTTTTSRTTTSTTTSTTTTTTTTTNAPKQDKPTLLGDSNCDGIVDLSDAVLIMQALANPNKYGKQGTAELHISEQGWINADVHQKGNGVSTNDALAIQLKLLGRISGFPIDVLN